MDKCFQSRHEQFIQKRIRFIATTVQSQHQMSITIFARTPPSWPLGVLSPNNILVFDDFVDCCRWWGQDHRYRPKLCLGWLLHVLIANIRHAALKNHIRSSKNGCHITDQPLNMPMGEVWAKSAILTSPPIQIGLCVVAQNGATSVAPGAYAHLWAARCPNYTSYPAGLGTNMGCIQLPKLEEHPSRLWCLSHVVRDQAPRFAAEMSPAHCCGVIYDWKKGVNEFREHSKVGIRLRCEWCLLRCCNRLFQSCSSIFMSSYLRIST